MKLRVKKFQPDKVKEHRISFIVGKRGTGKTVILKDVLSHHPPVDFCLAMSPTEETVEMFREFLPETCIFSEFNQHKLEQMLAVQRELIRKKINRTFLLILDDCMYQKGVLKSTAMRDLVMNGRHLHITMIMVVQYLMDITPDVRANIDYVYALRENIISNRMKLFKFFFGMFPKYEEFDKVMNACTANYSCMIMDNTSKSTEVEDTVFWYKADINPPPFRLGRECYWKMNKKCQLSAEDMENELARQRGVLTDKNAGKITVVQTTDHEGKPLRDSKIPPLVL